MSTHDLNPETLLDHAIAEVRDDLPDPTVEREAAARVWERLSRQAPAAPGRGTAPAEHIRSCADYQSLIPSYLAGELPAARVLLLEDHTRECIPCRKALKAARSGEPVRARRRGARPSSDASTPSRIWLALAASLLLVAGLAGALALSGVFGGPELGARVAAVEGSLLRLDGERALPLELGAEIAEGEVLRTTRGSRAVVRLGDGSQVEVRERSELSFDRGRRGTTVRVDRGDIIVEAAKQHDGHLYVATDDCLVSVTGTIFSVSHGTKGSRVSVIEGAVTVEENRGETVLHPGDQIATRQALGSVPVEQEVAWSRNRERYAELLAELKALDEELQRTLAATGLRYDSRLLRAVPADTAIYLAMPNLSDELAEMYASFERRLADSEVLARWWQERVGEGGFDAHLEEVVGHVRDLGAHLGEEIVVALSLGEDGDPEGLLVLAEVVRPAAFAAVLADEVERLNAQAGGHLPLVVVADPSTAAAVDGAALYLWPAGDVFAAATDLARLRELAAILAAPGSEPFAGTSFYTSLAEAYGQGAQWLAGVDVGRILAGATGGDGDDDARALEFTGLRDVEHLIIERKARDETVHTGAVLSFADVRRGAASWLAAPAPMGSLEFLSADTNLAAAFVVEDPATILEETFRFVEATDPDFRGELDRFQAEHGVDVLADLAAPLGGEMAFALDGPALPKPAWKVVAEVYDPAGLERALEWAVEQVNGSQVAQGEEPGLSHSCQETGGRTYCVIGFSAGGQGSGAMEIHYTFEDGYLIAAPARGLLDRALQVRRSGYTLVDAPDFTALLPQDGYLNFSAVFYSNLGSLGDALMKAASGAGLPEEQRQALENLDLGSPVLTCAYGADDAIRLVSTSRGGLLTSRLGSLLGLSMFAADGVGH